MSKKFDAQAAQKIINEYAEWVNYYIKENNVLKEQLKDIRLTLSINKDLMFKSVNGDNIIEELKRENIRLTNVINCVNKEKAELENKVWSI
jgi:hypothetical protein